MGDHLSRKLVPAVVAGVAGLAVASGVCAQTMNNNGANYNAGYGRVADQENSPTIAPSVRDANGNLVIVDGVIQAGQDQSVYSSAGATSGAQDAVSGVGAGGASAVGNQLTVVTQGNWNTVIVNSVQNNSGNVSASTSSLNGGVSNGH